MISQAFRARVALQIARVAIPGAIVGTVSFVNACTDQDRSPTRPSGAPMSALVASGVEDATYYGKVVPVGPGNARTYVVVNQGAPVEIGVELNAGALAGLPTAGAHDGHNNTHHQMTDAWDLPLPAEAGATAYKSVNIGWMPAGHEPPYNRPHFDFHFYVVSTEERLAIDPADPEWAQKASALPSQEYWPARYFPLNLLVNKPASAVTVPGMGLHWLDVASPELNGGEFRNTLFYGSWNGRIIFDEPMITKALLESRETVDVTLPPAARYASEGLRAGGYRVYFDEATQRHRVALTQLANR